MNWINFDISFCGNQICTKKSTCWRQVGRLHRDCPERFSMMEFEQVKGKCGNYIPVSEIVQDSIIIEIPELPESLNKILTMHWGKRKAYKDRCRLLVKSAINKKGLTKIEGCVIIHYKFIFNNKHRHDFDNYAGGCKYYQDQISESLLEDDNMDIIKGLEFDYEIGKERKTIITIRSVK